MKKYRLVTLVGLAFVSTFLNEVKAQTLSAPTIPDSFIAKTGETKTNTVQTGSRSSLTFGTSTTIGTSASMTSSGGSSITSESILKPASATMSSSLGQTGTLGQVTAEISNLRGSGSGDHNVGDSTIKSTDSAIAEGSTKITGVETGLKLELDKVETRFESTIKTIGSSDSNTSQKASSTSNASASSNVQSNATADISNTSFNTVFSQAF